MKIPWIVCLIPVLLTGCTTTGPGVAPVEAFDRLAVLHPTSDYKSVKLVFGLDGKKPLGAQSSDSQRVEWYELSPRFAILLTSGRDKKGDVRLQVVSFSTLDEEKPGIMLHPNWQFGRGMTKPAPNR